MTDQGALAVTPCLVIVGPEARRGGGALFGARWPACCRTLLAIVWMSASAKRPRRFVPIDARKVGRSCHGDTAGPGFGHDGIVGAFAPAVVACGPAATTRVAL
jgi:hypothetical protein